jgi:cytochrome b561
MYPERNRMSLPARAFSDTQKLAERMNSGEISFKHTYNRRIYLTMASVVVFAVLAIIMQYVALATMTTEERTRLTNAAVSGIGALLSLLILLLMGYRIIQVVFTRSNQVPNKQKRASIIRRATIFTFLSLVPLSLWSVAFVAQIGGDPSNQANKAKHVPWLVIAASAFLLLQAAVLLPDWRSVRGSVRNRMASSGLYRGRSNGMPSRLVATLGESDAESTRAGIQDYDDET